VDKVVSTPNEDQAFVDPRLSSGGWPSKEQENNQDSRFKIQDYQICG